ncbi:MAG TPA: hypothetical protein VEY12_11125, partial [Thermoplasmata archaeon]|nr:hypothetical protein [Thermoplasmata archaeon]
PEDVAQRLEPRRKEFRAFNVGLMAVNVKEKSVKVIVLPRAEKPTSQPHYLFAIATFLRRMNGGRKVVARRP